jgi:hypothetical protein
MRFDEDPGTPGLTEKGHQGVNYPSINLRAILATNLRMGNKFLHSAQTIDWLGEERTQ